MRVQELGQIIREAGGPLDLDEPTIEYLVGLVLGTGPHRGEERVVLLHHRDGQLQVTVVRVTHFEAVA